MDRPKYDFFLIANRVMTSKIWIFWSLIITVLYINMYLHQCPSSSPVPPCTLTPIPPTPQTSTTPQPNPTDAPTPCPTPQQQDQTTSPPSTTTPTTVTTNSPEKKEMKGWSTAVFFVGNSTLTEKTDIVEYNSQVGQDRLILEILGNKSGGYYVDLASNEAKYISNTFTLETYFGWNGICIEANPKYFHEYIYASPKTLSPS